MIKDRILRPDLKPCPFCGGVPYEESYDRLINIGCGNCNFHLYFPGLVQSQFQTDVIASYDKEHNPSAWYDKDAHEKADAKWNNRYNEGD